MRGQGACWPLGTLIETTLWKHLFADRAAKVAAALGRLPSEGRVKGGAVIPKALLALLSVESLGTTWLGHVMGLYLVTFL